MVTTAYQANQAGEEAMASLESTEGKVWLEIRVLRDTLEDLEPIHSQERLVSLDVMVCQAEEAWSDPKELRENSVGLV